MEESKVMFSPSELSLMQNSELFLTKNGIIRNIYDLFGEISTSFVTNLQHNGPDWLSQISASPKISKGEQYEEMPWVMLDYPRIFIKAKGVFALRTFFWWGNYFTVQWIVSGIFIKKAMLEKKIGNLPAYLRGFPVYCGIVDDPWINSIPQEGLEKVEDQIFEFSTLAGNTLKIAIKVPLNRWADLSELCVDMCNLLLQEKTN